MDSIVNFIGVAVPLIFGSNLLMSALKYVSQQAMTSLSLRVVLVVLAVVGVFSLSAVTGNPVNFDSITSLVTLTVQSVVVAIGAHFSYKAIKNA